MKKKIFFLGMAILILSLGLVFVGCGGGSNSKLNGTWTYTGPLGMTESYVLENGKYQIGASGKGTYTVKGSMILFKETEHNYGDGWEATKPVSEFSATLNGDTEFVWNTATYKKK